MTPGSEFKSAIVRATFRIRKKLRALRENLLTAFFKRLRDSSSKLINSFMSLVLISALEEIFLPANLFH